MVVDLSTLEFVPLWMMTRREAMERKEVMLDSVYAKVPLKK